MWPSQVKARRIDDAISVWWGDGKDRASYMCRDDGCEAQDSSPDTTPHFNCDLPANDPAYRCEQEEHAKAVSDFIREYKSGSVSGRQMETFTEAFRKMMTTGSNTGQQDAHQFLLSLKGSLPFSLADSVTRWNYACGNRVFQGSGPSACPADIVLDIELMKAHNSIKNYLNHIHSSIVPLRTGGDTGYEQCHGPVHKNEEFEIRGTGFTITIQYLTGHEQEAPKELNNFIDLNMNFNGSEYFLSGVVFQSGTTEAGHYTTLICTPSPNMWYHCSDDIIKRVTPSILSGKLQSFNSVTERGEKPTTLFYRKGSLSDHEPLPLRNCGNTCFINAILQNIVRFV